MSKFVCEICGKEYSQERHYLKHVEKCSKNEQKEDEKDQIDPIVDEKNPILDEKETKMIPVGQEVISFFDRLGGRRVGNHLEIQWMFKWYRELWPNAPVAEDPNCSSCVAHVYNNLKKYYDKHKQTKNNNKENCC